MRGIGHWRGSNGCNRNACKCHRPTVLFPAGAAPRSPASSRAGGRSRLQARYMSVWWKVSTGSMPPMFFCRNRYSPIKPAGGPQIDVPGQQLGWIALVADRHIDDEIAFAQIVHNRIALIAADTVCACLGQGRRFLRILRRAKRQSLCTSGPTSCSAPRAPGARHREDTGPVVFPPGLIALATVTGATYTAADRRAPAARRRIHRHPSILPLAGLR